MGAPYKKPVPENRTVVDGIWSDILDDIAAAFETSARGITGLGVFVQDQTTDALDIAFLESLNETTIAADTVRDTNTFTATSGHGIIAGNIIEISNENVFIQALVLNVAGDVITIDSPINHVYLAGSPLFVSSAEMNVAGTPASPRIFSVKPGPGQSGDMVRVIIQIQDDSGMDFTTFGGLPELENGCLIRIKRQNGDYTNLFNWKSNGGFIIRSFDHDFQSKIGGGLFGFVARSTWGGQSKRGVVIRLDGGKNEELQVLVQDDLTGLSRMVMVAQGHELQENL
jgi:hypothetical protein